MEAFLWTESMNDLSSWSITRSWRRNKNRTLKIWVKCKLFCSPASKSSRLLERLCPLGPSGNFFYCATCSLERVISNCAIQAEKHNATNSSKDNRGHASWRTEPSLFLFVQLQPSAEETDDTSGNTIDLSTIDSSPSLSPNMGKTVDLPLTILNASPLRGLHQPQQVLL